MHITYYYPWGFFHPIRSGAAVVADRHLSYFRARGYRPRVIVLGNGTAEAQAAFEDHYSWVEDVHVFPPERSAAVQRNYEVWDFGRFLAAHAAIAEVPEFRDVLSRPTDLVFLNYAFSAPLLEAVPRGASRVLESLDIISRQFLRQRPSAALLEHHLGVEFALYQMFDAVLMINEEEAAFAEQRGVTNSHYMPRGMDVSDALGGYEHASGVQYDLVFVGSNHGPNVEGARRFYEQVFAPRLRSRGMRWAIVGSVCEQLDFRDPAVTMLGQVEDLDDVYRRTKVVIVPLFSGTGTSIKTLEAMAHGKPVVTTPCGVRGIPNCEEQVVTFDFDGAPSLVAEAIAELCQSRVLRESYAQKSTAYVLKHFGPLGYGQRMDEVLEPLVSSRTGSTSLSVVRAA